MEPHSSSQSSSPLAFVPSKWRIDWYGGGAIILLRWPVSYTMPPDSSGSIQCPLVGPYKGTNVKVAEGFVGLIMVKRPTYPPDTIAYQYNKHLANNKTFKDSFQRHPLGMIYGESYKSFHCLLHLVAIYQPYNCKALLEVHLTSAPVKKTHLPPYHRLSDLSSA